MYWHFSNYWQIIDIEIRLPEIIGYLKELSISISKLPGKLSKNDLSLTPTLETFDQSDTQEM